MLYPVAIFLGDDLHAHGLETPDIPGCFSACDELDDALAMAWEAAAGCLEMMTEQGMPIPAANTIMSYSSRPEFAGCIWALLDITLPSPSQPLVLVKSCKPSPRSPEMAKTEGYHQEDIFERIDALASHRTDKNPPTKRQLLRTAKSTC